MRGGAREREKEKKKEIERDNFSPGHLTKCLCHLLSSQANRRMTVQRFLASCSPHSNTRTLNSLILPWDSLPCPANAFTCLLSNSLCFSDLRVPRLLTQPTLGRKCLFWGWMNRKWVRMQKAFLDQNKYLILMLKAAAAFTFSKHFVYIFGISKDNY